MTLRFHELAEQHHRILNPFTEQQLMELGAICQLRAGMRQLDLCCGKGEMLARWAADAGISGVGVDISPIFLAAAHQRAAELGVAEQLTFVEAAASTSNLAASTCATGGASWAGASLRCGCRKGDPQARLPQASESSLPTA